MTTLSCPHAAQCCARTTLALSYEEQLDQKTQRAKTALRRYPHLTAGLSACQAAAPASEYRTRAKLAVGANGAIGVFKPGTHTVVDLPQCIALSPLVRKVADGVREEIAAFRIAPYLPERGIGMLRYLDIRASQADNNVHLLIVLRADEAPLEAFEVAESLMARIPELIGVAANLNPGDGPQILGKKTVALVGKQEIWEDVGGVRLRYSPGTFSQAHRGQAETLQRRVREQLAPTKTHELVDLYGGVGLFSLALLPECKKATLIESFAPAAEDAKAAARAMRLPLEVVAAPAEKAIAKLPAQEAAKRLFVVNPPRRGLAVDVLEALCRQKAQRVAYVSCDPETLARDLDYFAWRGLRLAGSIETFDMIPLTEEVESLAVLQASKPLSFRVLYQDEYLVAIDKPYGFDAHLAQHAEDDVARRLSAQLSKKLMPVHRIDRDTSGVLLYATSSKAAEAMGRLFSEGQIEKEYLTLAKGKTNPKGTINRPLREHGKDLEARTRFKHHATVAGHSLLAVDLQTGRNHQIRRHLSGIGHPIIGDERYGHEATNRHFAERFGLQRAFLHAHRMAFVHPFTEMVVSLRAPLPGDLALVLDRAEERQLADELCMVKR